MNTDRKGTKRTGRFAIVGKLTGVMLFFILIPDMLFATVYYFSSSGKDSNIGTDPGAPKQTLQAAADLALPGNSLLFRRGDSWYNPFVSFDLSGKSGTQDNPVLIDAYGSGEKPVIASLDLLDEAGWNHISGTNTWQQTVKGYSDAFRLFVDGVSRYKVNTSNASNNETAVDLPSEWYIQEIMAGQQGCVYVNTGSAATPPVSVEIHPVGSVSTLLMQNSHDIIIRNIDFRGGSRYNVIDIEAPSSGIVIDHCIIKEANGSGIVVSNLGLNKEDYVSDITITNNLVDKVWSSFENDPAIYLSGDGIFILHAVDSGLVRRNTVRNWGHSGITLSSYAYGYHGVHHIIVEQNDVSAGASGYMHALDVDGFDGYTTHNIIRRNYFHDYTSTSHVQGNNNQYYSNIFAGVKLTSQPRQSQQPWGMDLIPWKYADGHWMAARDNYIVNNTIVGCEGYPVVMADDPNSTSVVGNNIIANNIICQYGSAVGLNITSAVRGTVRVQNNNIWNFNEASGVARYKSNTPYSAAVQMDRANPDVCSGNVQVDPFFADFGNRDLRLTTDSPAEVRTGGTNSYAGLLGPEFTDYFGCSWDPEKPSMGAIQYTVPTDGLLFQGKSLSGNQPPGTIVGNLSRTSSDPALFFSYELVAGEGDRDNNLFVIVYDKVTTTALLKADLKSFYQIRVRATDPSGNFSEESFVIDLTLKTASAGSSAACLRAYVSQTGTRQDRLCDEKDYPSGMKNVKNKLEN